MNENSRRTYKEKKADPFRVKSSSKHRRENSYGVQLGMNPLAKQVLSQEKRYSSSQQPFSQSAPSTNPFTSLGLNQFSQGNGLVLICKPDKLELTPDYTQDFKDLSKKIQDMLRNEPNQTDEDGYTTPRNLQQTKKVSSRKNKLRNRSDDERAFLNSKKSKSLKKSNGQEVYYEEMIPINFEKPRTNRTNRTNHKQRRIRNPPHNSLLRESGPQSRALYSLNCWQNHKNNHNNDNNETPPKRALQKEGMGFLGNKVHPSGVKEMLGMREYETRGRSLEAGSHRPFDKSFGGYSSANDFQSRFVSRRDFVSGSDSHELNSHKRPKKFASQKKKEVFQYDSNFLIPLDDSERRRPRSHHTQNIKMRPEDSSSSQNNRESLRAQTAYREKSSQKKQKTPPRKNKFLIGGKKASKNSVPPIKKSKTGLFSRKTVKLDEGLFEPNTLKNISSSDTLKIINKYSEESWEREESILEPAEYLNPEQHLESHLLKPNFQPSYNLSKPDCIFVREPEPTRLPDVSQEQWTQNEEIFEAADSPGCPIVENPKKYCSDGLEPFKEESKVQSTPVSSISHTQSQDIEFAAPLEPICPSNKSSSMKEVLISEPMLIIIDTFCDSPYNSFEHKVIEANKIKNQEKERKELSCTNFQMNIQQVEDDSKPTNPEQPPQMLEISEQPLPSLSSLPQTVPFEALPDPSACPPVDEEHLMAYPSEEEGPPTQISLGRPLRPLGLPSRLASEGLSCPEGLPLESPLLSKRDLSPRDEPQNKSTICALTKINRPDGASFSRSVGPTEISQAIDKVQTDVSEISTLKEVKLVDVYSEENEILYRNRDEKQILAKESSEKLVTQSGISNKLKFAPSDIIEEEEELNSAMDHISPELKNSGMIEGPTKIKNFTSILKNRHKKSLELNENNQEPPNPVPQITSPIKNFDIIQKPINSSERSSQMASAKRNLEIASNRSSRSKNRKSPSPNDQISLSGFSAGRISSSGGLNLKGSLKDSQKAPSFKAKPSFMSIVRKTKMLQKFMNFAKPASDGYKEALRNDKRRIQLLDQVGMPKVNSSQVIFKDYGAVKGIAINTHPGRCRSYNEDRVTLMVQAQQKYDKICSKEVTSCHYFGIYDGHGGDDCVNMVRDKLHSSVLSCFDAKDPETSIKHAFVNFDQEILDKTIRESKNEASGACASGLILLDNSMVFFNLGNSRTIMSFERGKKIDQVSVNHLPDQTTEMNRIFKNNGKVYRVAVRKNSRACELYQAKNMDEFKQIQRILQEWKDPSTVFGPWRVKPGGLTTTRSLGDAEAKLKEKGGAQGVTICDPFVKKVEFSSLKNMPDFILMATDGLFDVYSNEEVCNHIYTEIHNWLIKKKAYLVKTTFHEVLDEIIKDLIKGAMERHSEDNITVLLLLFEDFLNISLSGDDYKIPPAEKQGLKGSSTLRSLYSASSHKDKEKPSD